ncbi:MAG: hypothetical protein OER04_18270 [Cyclobacteriaceae bacterium]|nr:hypothetical protein [Cyclobacteriaceae bacterium]
MNKRDPYQTYLTKEAELLQHLDDTSFAFWMVCEMKRDINRLQQRVKDLEQSKVVVHLASEINTGRGQEVFFREDKKVRIING